MTDNWPIVPLRNCVDILTGFAFKSDHYSDLRVGPRLCLGANVAPGRPDWSKLRFWPDAMISDDLEKYFLADGDVILAMDRPWIPSGLKLFRFSNEGEPALLVQRVARMRGTSSLDAGFLYSALRHPNFVDYILNVQTGTTVPHISIGQILDYKLHLPPMAIQRKIARILGAIDDKIALNTKVNETLEEMAQALFKSWFVDFDGHDDLVESELGPIPRGWSVKPLSLLIEVIGGGTPKRSEARYWGGRIPWFSVQDAPAPSDVFVLSTAERITDEGLTESSARQVPAGTTIISARGTVGRLALAGQSMAFNQSCYGIRPSSGQGDYFIYYLLRNVVTDLQRAAHGSVFDTIARSTFEGTRVVAPPVQRALEFNSLITPLMERIANNGRQTATLAEIRDTLLPKLISGELRVPEAEKALSETA